MSTSRLDEVRTSFLADLESAGGDASEVEKVRIKYAGKKSGVLNELTAALRELPNEDKRAYGQALNGLKKEIESKLKTAKDAAGKVVKVKSKKVEAKGHPATVSAGQGPVDVTLPGSPWSAAPSTRSTSCGGGSRRSSCAWATTSRRGPRSRTTGTTSRPSTFHPTTRRATTRTPSIFPAVIF